MHHALLESTSQLKLTALTRRRLNERASTARYKEQEVSWPPDYHSDIQNGRISSSQ